jgi:hypothetical protein
MKVTSISVCGRDPLGQKCRSLVRYYISALKLAYVPAQVLSSVKIDSESTNEAPDYVPSQIPAFPYIKSRSYHSELSIIDLSTSQAPTHIDSRKLISFILTYIYNQKNGYGITQFLFSKDYKILLYTAVTTM